MQSTVINRLNDEGRPNQETIHLRDAAIRCRAQINMVQNVLLIWLDSSIDEKSADCKNILTELQRIVNGINTFTDSNECIQFVDAIADNHVCIIMSDSFCSNIVPRIHNMAQVDSILITSNNKEQYEE